MHSEIERFGVVSLETAQKIWDNSLEFKALNDRIAELNKIVPDRNVGHAVSETVSVAKKLKIDEFTDNFYEHMRNISSDISAIADNTGIDRYVIEKIKNHVFYDVHELRNGS